MIENFSQSSQRNIKPAKRILFCRGVQLNAPTFAISPCAKLVEAIHELPLLHYRDWCKSFLQLSGVAAGSYAFLLSNYKFKGWVGSAFICVHLRLIIGMVWDLTFRWSIVIS